VVDGANPGASDAGDRRYRRRAHLGAMTFTAVALGLVTALSFGASDFLGGLASRRVDESLAVVALLKLTAVAAFMVGIPFAGAAPGISSLAWGAAGGLAVGIGYVAYFRGLVVGRMGVVASVTAVWSAIVPLAVGVALGERPLPLAWIGSGLILVAIILITYTRSQSNADSGEPALDALPPEHTLLHCAADGAPVQKDRELGLTEALVAGISFGSYFVALDRAGATADGGGALAWPLLAATAAAALLVGSVAAAREVDWLAALSQVRVIAVAGLLYGLGSWSFITAVGQGWLSIVAVVAALSPAPTMLMARSFLHEHLSTRQLLGSVLALAGVMLVTASLPG
jgi:drug/metabolite transporter (DMT)-like permease